MNTRVLCPQSSCLCWLPVLAVASLALVLGAPARSQQPADSPESLTDAARLARERVAESKPAKVVRNDDFRTAATSTASDAATTPAPSATGQPGAPAEPGADCNNPANDQIKADLQAAQDELDQLRGELSKDLPVISGDNVDMNNFKPGGSGLALSSPALSQAVPQSPERIREVELEQRVASLKQAEQIACDSPKDGRIQKQIDEAQSRLKLAQAEFALDQNAYYSRPDYANDTAGQAKLDAEQEQIQSLQSEIDDLKSQLPPPDTNQNSQ
jgi:hypothetical protein